MAVDCLVDEKQISRFTELLQRTADGQDSIFTITLPDQSIYPLPGRLSFLDRSVDYQTGTIRIRVIFSNPQQILKPGITCDLRVKSSIASALLIPSLAVTEQMGEFFVFAVRQNHATQQRVHLGMTIGDKIVVKSGLQPGDVIVTEGMQRLRENALVAAVPTHESHGM